MEKKTRLLIPGPTPVVDSIREQMWRDIQAHGDPRFIADYKKLIDELHEMFHCDGQTFVVAGTGTLGMEMAIANTTKRGDAALVIDHGFFSGRFADICRRKGLDTDVLTCELGDIVSIDEMEAALKQKNYAVLALSHVETATGVVVDLKAIGQMLQKFPNTLFIVDGVCATAAEYENMQEQLIDILITGSQKAFGVCPGLFMLWASKRAVARRDTLGEIPEFYIDFMGWKPVMDNPANYWATPAINLVWSLAEAVRIIKEEGIMNRYLRHKKNAEALRLGIEAMGLTIFTKKEHCAVTLSNMHLPEGVSHEQMLKALFDEGIMAAGGMGSTRGMIFRLGHMGNVDINDTVIALSAVERALNKMGKLPKMGEGISVYMQEMSKP